MSHTRGFYGGLSRWAESLINILALLPSQENGDEVEISQLALFSNQPSSRYPPTVTSLEEKKKTKTKKHSYCPGN